MKPIELRLIFNKNGLTYKDDILRTPELANNFSWMDYDFKLNGIFSF